MWKTFELNIKKVFFIAKIFRNITPFNCYGRIFFNVIKNSIRIYTPSSAVLGLTYRCQCRCVHCSAGLYTKKEELELSTQEWFFILDRIFEIGVPRINLSGGEALLRADIFDIIKYASSKFVVILESNGLLLTEYNVKRLKNSRVSCVAVSIDSPDSPIHNNLREFPGCFEKAIEGIIRLRKNNIPCLISTYFTSERTNAENIKALTTLANKLGVLAVRVMPARPIGNFSSYTFSLLSKKDEDYILQHIDHSRVYFKGLPAPKMCGVFCKATFYISPYGEIQPCPYLPFTFGNARSDSLHSILNRMQNYYISLVKKDRSCLVLNREFLTKHVAPIIEKRDIDLPIKCDVTTWPLNNRIR